MRELTTELREQAGPITAAVVERMYANPFWHGKFGERGLYHAKNDGQFHIRYLVTSLDVGAPSVMVEYARWLRGVLVKRGMCTHHLIDNFNLISKELAIRNLPDVANAQEYLAAAVDGLIYPAGAPCDLQINIDRVVEHMSRDLTDNHSATEGSAVVSGVSDTENQRYLVSFLADALAYEDADPFAQHVSWQQDYLTSVGACSDHLERLLEALELAAVMVSAPAARQVSDVIEQGRLAAKGASV